MTESTPTQTKPDTTINDLKTVVREASKLERSLAVETDELPDKIKEAARQSARRQARAAREGGTGAAVQEAAERSPVPAMRERQASLPHLRWAQQVKVAALQVELHDAEIAAAEQRAREARTGLDGLRLDAEKAQAAYDERRRAYRKAVGAKESLASRRAVHARELRHLEETMPGV